MADRHTARQRKGNLAASWTVLGIVVIGWVLVAAPVVGHWDELWRDPFGPPPKVTTVEALDAKGSVIGTERTTEPASGSVIELALAPGGLVLVRLALVVVAAFVAGAIVKNVVLGRYPSKLAGVELDPLTDKVEATARQAEQLVSDLAKEVGDKLAESARRTAAAIETVQEETRRELGRRAARERRPAD